MSRRISRRALLGGSAAAAGARVLGARGRAAAAGADAPGELPRHVLALYKSSELDNDVQGRRPKTATINEVHGWAQMPLNWLGLMVEYHDIDQGLPDERAMARYRGIVTWYQTEEIAEPLAYLRWLGAQMRAGRRVVILGYLGALRDRRTLRSLDLAAVNEAARPQRAPVPRQLDRQPARHRAPPQGQADDELSARCPPACRTTSRWSVAARTAGPTWSWPAGTCRTPRATWS